MLCFFKDYFISKDFFQKEYSKEIPVVSNISSCGGYKSAKSDRVHNDIRKKSVEELINVVTLDEDEQLNVLPTQNPIAPKSPFGKC